MHPKYGTEGQAHVHRCCRLYPETAHEACPWPHHCVPDVPDVHSLTEIVFCGTGTYPDPSVQDGGSGGRPAFWPRL